MPAPGRTGWVLVRGARGARPRAEQFFSLKRDKEPDYHSFHPRRPTDLHMGSPQHTRSVTQDPALLLVRGCLGGEHMWVRIPMLLATEAGCWASRPVNWGSHQHAGVCWRPSPPPRPHPRGQENERKPMSVKVGTVRRTVVFSVSPKSWGLVSRGQREEVGIWS